MGDAAARTRAPAVHRLQLDEDHGSIRKFPADDPLSCEAKAVAIERRARSRSSTPMVTTVRRGCIDWLSCKAER